MEVIMKQIYSNPVADFMAVTFTDILTGSPSISINNSFNVDGEDCGNYSEIFKIG